LRTFLPSDIEVAALRADIDHYRRGEVISAKPVSPVDLLKKLVLRNKVVPR
jgi:hypothetical protein